MKNELRWKFRRWKWILMNSIFVFCYSKILFMLQWKYVFYYSISVCATVSHYSWRQRLRHEQWTAADCYSDFTICTVNFTICTVNLLFAQWFSFSINRPILNSFFIYWILERSFREKVSEKSSWERKLKRVIQIGDLNNIVA